MMKEKYNSKFFKDNFPALAKSFYFNTGSEGLLPRITYQTLSKLLKKMFKYGASHPEYFDFINMYNNKLIEIIEEIGLDYKNLIRVSSASEGLNYAFNMYDFNKDDKVLILDFEFKTGVLAAEALRRKTGIEIVWAKNVEEYMDKIESGNIRAALISHVDYRNGQVFDIEKIYKKCVEKHVYFVVDGAQSFGNIFWDFKHEIHADMYVWTAHKWGCSPRGSAYIIPSERIINKLAPVSIHYFATKNCQPGIIPELNGFLNDFSAHYNNFFGEAGFVSSYKFIKKKIGFQNALERIKDNRIYLTEKLNKLNLNVIPSDSGLISFNLINKNLNPEFVNNKLFNHRLVLRTIPDTDFLRVSVHFYNTKKDIDYFIKILSKILEGNYESKKN